MDGERQGRNGPALYLASETTAGSGWVRGQAEAEVILVYFGVEPKAYCWAVAGALSLISPSSLQRTLPTTLRSPSPLQNVPNNRAPRADLAQKSRQGLLRVSESSGLV